MFATDIIELKRQSIFEWWYILSFGEGLTGQISELATAYTEQVVQALNGNGGGSSWTKAEEKTIIKRALFSCCCWWCDHKHPLKRSLLMAWIAAVKCWSIAYLFATYPPTIKKASLEKETCYYGKITGADIFQKAAESFENDFCSI